MNYEHEKAMEPLPEDKMQDSWTAWKFIPGKKFHFEKGEEDGDTFSIVYKRNSPDIKTWTS